jgi:alpha-tubulin suppressor-like RCC1 family protein
MTFSVNSKTVIDSNRNFIVGSGAVRPSSPEAGRIWFNSALNKLEGWNGTEWVSLLGNIGTAWAWGLNSYGRLGTNNVLSRRSPVEVVGGFTDWVQISAGGYHTAAIRDNGTAWAWGRNNYGQLGDNSTTSKSSPVSVVGGFTDWVQIDAGALHTVAIRSNGTAWAWGSNGNGRLGDNSTTNTSSPVSVVGGYTDWVQIRGGRFHTAAIRANGTAWAWGWNGYGQLGDNSTTSRRSPVSVVGGYTDWVQIDACFSFHTAAIRANGTAWAWGRNGNGQLGDNSTTNRSSPVSVVGGYTDWVQISAGGYHNAAIRANGTAWAWGRNASGQLGTNNTTNTSSPVSVVGGFTDWVQIDGGGYHTFALRANGTAWAWGSNSNGRLGDNSTTNRSSPVSEVIGFTDWVQIGGGREHNVGIR